MFQILQKSMKFKNIVKLSTINISKRTFLSQAYYCAEVWDKRLNNNLFQKINLEELYQELDQRFQKTRQMSAVDVDIFANAINNNVFIDEMLDLVHKLRLSADTGNTLKSTPHAVVRALLKFGNKKDLLDVLDDRLNYGIFLDFYTSNILMDTYWKEKDFTAGARIASQLMLQEDFDHPISYNFSLLHCYNYLLNPGEWPIPLPPEEPEEEVKIRVKYLRNPFDDDHFDLKDPQKIIGKTLASFTKYKEDSLSKSLNILGWTLYDKEDKVEKALIDCKDKNLVLYKDILDLIPEDKTKVITSDIKYESINVQQILKENVEKAVQVASEKDISEQCKIFSLWDEERIAALEEQKQRVLISKRLAHIEDMKKTLEEKETKLWFFDNEEIIELLIEEKQQEQEQQQSKIENKS